MYRLNDSLDLSYFAHGQGQAIQINVSYSNSYQSQSWKTYCCCHLSHLSIFSFCYCNRNPARWSMPGISNLFGRGRYTVREKRVTTAFQYPRIARQRLCDGSLGRYLQPGFYPVNSLLCYLAIDLAIVLLLDRLISHIIRFLPACSQQKKSLRILVETPDRHGALGEGIELTQQFPLLPPPSCVDKLSQHPWWFVHCEMLWHFGGRRVIILLVVGHGIGDVTCKLIDNHTATSNRNS